MSKEVKVNPYLYDFMKTNEINLYVDEKTKEINVFLFINHLDIEYFTEIVGKSYFNPENEVMVNLQGDCIVIDIYDIITEWFEHKVSDYSNCFDCRDWERYKDLILESEVE